MRRTHAHHGEKSSSLGNHTLGNTTEVSLTSGTL